MNILKEKRNQILFFEQNTTSIKGIEQHINPC